MTRLNALWQQIAEYGRNLQNVPLSEIQGRLDAFKAQIMEVIESDPSATPGGSAGTAPATTGSLAGSQPDGDPRCHPGLPRHASRRSPARPRPLLTAPAATRAPAPAEPQPTDPLARPPHRLR